VAVATDPPHPGEDAATGPARPVPARLGRRALSNLLRMGHCAPTLVQTLLEPEGAATTERVILAAALPGMGNSGSECGGITGPLVVLGLRHSRDPAIDGAPAPVALGRALVDAFRADHGTTRCRDILGDARLPLRCFGVVRRAPGRYLALESGVPMAPHPAEVRAAHGAFCAHLSESGFHCTQSVLRASAESGAASPDLLDASSAFVGGTALSGQTCGALTGGLLLLGRRLGAIEDSHLRVLWQVATMAVRGDAFADERNAFNRAMNRGHDLARWFTDRYGSSQCRELTGCDFDCLEGTRRYVEGGQVARCARMAREVAARVEEVVALEGTRAGATSPPRPLP
jgi:hypothetical protein